MANTTVVNRLEKIESKVAEIVNQVSSEAKGSIEAAAAAGGPAFNYTKGHDIIFLRSVIRGIEAEIAMITGGTAE